MATVDRQDQPPAGPASGNGRPVGEGGAPGPITLPRVLALGALALVVLIVAYLLFSGSSSGRYHLIFQRGGELVRGDQVQVGGVPVGSVKTIELTHDFKARVTIEVESSLLPLHRGTTAQIRVPSLTSVASRYIALTPGPNNAAALPNGATLSTASTKSPVNLSELFDTLNPPTRKGLQELIEGTATQYQHVGRQINAATPYFSPALRATNHVFNELTREESTLSSVLVEAAKALETLGDHRAELASLVRNAGTTFGALASRATNLEAALKALPETLHEGNRAFARLPRTAAALRRLIVASRPGAKPLTRLLPRLQGLLALATPVTAQLSSAFSKPGPNNDFTDLVRAVPGLLQVLRSASPDTVKALNQSVPITSFFGPYSPDLIGLFRTFGQLTGYRDANGQYARFSPNFADFALNAGKLTPVTSTQGLEGLLTKQLRRCPGGATQPAADGSSPFTDEGLLGCDPAEVP